MIKDELLEGSPALVPFLVQYAELIKNGHALPFTPHNEKSRVVYEIEGGIVKGGIVFNLNRLTQVGWIVFSFTVPEFRRSGVYSRLHVELERLVKEEGMTHIASHVHVLNAGRIASCERVGMRPLYLRMNKKLL